MTRSDTGQGPIRPVDPGHHRRPPGLRPLRRAAALVLVALMLLMALVTAGHGMAHLGHDHDLHACPVCQAIGGYEKLLAALLLLSLVLVNTPVRRQAGFLRLARLPLLPSLTPVYLKVKLTN